MFKRLGSAEIEDYGKRLNLGLSPAEIRVIESRLEELLGEFERLDEARIPEDTPRGRYTDRDPGYCPSDEEDPGHAFIRKCHIRGAESGPLAGRRIGLKDHIAVAGVPMSLGLTAFANYVPNFDATVVIRLLDAGATIVGKMNMDPMSYSGYGWGGVGHFGRPANPQDPAYLTGGSSSGSAVGVATGAVDCALGGDQAGSIRLPASWCGIVGLKPTFGLVPHTGIVGLDPVVDYAGPMTRTVSDAALVLECIAGPDGYDARQTDTLPRLLKYDDGLGEGVGGLRVGVLREGFGLEGSEEDVEAQVRVGLGLLEKAGARVQEVSVPSHELSGAALMPLFAQGIKMMFDTNMGGAFTRGFYPTSLMGAVSGLRRTDAHAFPPNIKFHLIAGSYLQDYTNGRLYAKAQNMRRYFVQEYRNALANVDVLAMPTCPFKPLRFVQPRDYNEALERTFQGGELAVNLGILARNTAPFNYTGHPAISIPCGMVNGLPVGMQLVADFLREDLLFRIGGALEREIAASDTHGQSPRGRAT